MEIPRTARLPIEVDVEATLPSGQPAAVTAASFALCGHGGPDALTVWLPAQMSGLVATITVAGVDAADHSGALVLRQARAELWMLPANGTTNLPGYVDTMELL